MAPKNLLKIDDILTGPKISSIASNRGRAFNLEREACTLAQASELLASSVILFLTLFPKNMMILKTGG